MGNFLGPKKMNHSCRKMANMGVKDRGFSVVTDMPKMTP